MLYLDRHMRKFSRLLTGLFALQIFAAGFCVITPVAHAADMPMQSQPLSSQATLNFDAACDKAAMAESKHTDHEMHACAHCDLPNELIANSVSNFNIDLPLIIFVASDIDMAVSLSVDLAMRPSTGPPLTPPLLHHTNQRILI